MRDVHCIDSEIPHGRALRHDNKPKPMLPYGSRFDKLTARAAAENSILGETSTLAFSERRPSWLIEEY